MIVSHTISCLIRGIPGRTLKSGSSLGLGFKTVPNYFRTFPIQGLSRQHGVRTFSGSARPQPELSDFSKINIKRIFLTKGSRLAITAALVSGILASFLLEGKVLCEALPVPPIEAKVKLPETKVETIPSEVISANKWVIAKQLMRDHWVLTILTVGSAVITTLIGLQIPIAIGSLVNVISNTLTSSAGGVACDLVLLKTPATVILRLFAAHAVAMASHIYLITLLGEGLGLELRAQVYQQCLSLDFHRFDLSRSGELTSSLNDDISDFKHTFKQCLTQGIRCVTLLGGTAYNLYSLSPVLSAYVASLVPVFYAGLYLYGHTLRQSRTIARTKESVSSGIAQEVMGAVRTVRAYAAEKWELARYSGALSESADANLVFGMHMGLFRGGMNLAVGSVILVVLYFGGQMVVRGEMQPGELMTFLVATEGAQKAMDALGGLMGQAVKAAGTCSRILSFLALPPSSTMTPLIGPGIILDSIRGEITFRNINFTYPSTHQPILKNLNLHVPAGTTLALVGASGAGKSTVAALLERFYEVPHGEILLDGIPLQLFDPTWLRGHVIGYLSQEPTLFAGTIAENICYGSNLDPKLNLDRIQQVAQAANIHRFIERLPNGYDTVVGERGATLSGGQKQRVAIARALLKDPKILILDEATSALDGRSEAAVQEALHTLMAGRTTLVIAHRLSTIQSAHQIAVLGPASLGDSVLEKGSHDQLLKLKGAYFSLFSKSKPQ